MSKSTFIQTNLNNGEISPKSLARVDHVKYAHSVKELENFITYQLGGVRFRPGMMFVAETKQSAVKSNLIPFQFSTGQSYVIEMGNLYARFYANKGKLIMRETSDIDLLCHFNGVDAAQAYTSDDLNARVATFYGTAQLDTAQKVFGTAAILFDGNSDYITFPHSADWSFGYGKFTIDLRVRFAVVTGVQYIMQQGAAGTDSWLIYYNGTEKRLYVQNIVSGSATKNFYCDFNPSAATWYHVEMDCESQSGTAASHLMFINGVLQSSVLVSGAWDAPFNDFDGVLTIGADIGHTLFYNGWIDELRIIKGRVVHTSTFSPETSAYNNSGGSLADGYAPEWVTSTAYKVGDYVSNANIVYYCLIAHTSGTFATDLVALDWVAQSHYEIPTPFTYSDFFELQYAQKSDLMYITHTDNFPQILTREGAVKFKIGNVNFVRGPFLDTNISNITITPSADSATTTLTATIPAWGAVTNYDIGDYVIEATVTYKCLVANYSAVFATELAAGYWVIENPVIFHAGHVGSLWRIKSGVVKITAYTSNTVVVGTVQPEPGGATGALATGPAATADWAEGVYSDYRGWPTAVAFHEQRLFYAKGQRIDGSVVGSFDNFESGTDDADAVSYKPNSEESNSIRWLASVSDKLQVGTSGGTFSLWSGTTGVPISPTAINIQHNDDVGSAQLRPVRIGSYLLYVHRNGFLVSELTYNIDTDRQEADDMTLWADHILRDGDGAFNIARQRSPNNRVWIPRADGQIAILTRNAKQDVMGWSRVIPAESSGIQGEVEGIAIIQQDDGDDEVWVIVKRTINSSVKRYVEYFSSEYFDDDFDPVLLDSALSLDSPITISGATAASPVVITAATHGLSDGDQVKIDNVLGMTELNNKAYLVAGAATDSFHLHDLDGADIDGLLYTAYLSGGEVRKMVTAISGLSHLNGETVYVQTDGGLPAGAQSFVVAGGAITLGYKAAVVHVGLLYEGLIKFLQLSDGVGQTKPRRVYLSTVRVDNSIGMQIGQDEDTLSTVDFVSPTVTDGVSPTLVTGDIEQNFQAWWDKDAEVVIKHSRPTPLFLLAAIFRSAQEER